MRAPVGRAAPRRDAASTSHLADIGAQWATAPLVHDAQRLSAGFIVFFFEEVGGP